MRRLDLILQWMEDDTEVIHKWEKRTKADDKKHGYGDSQSKRLAKMVAEGLQQLEKKQRDHVTKLHKYGLGPYCTIA
jgi:hypothetical protein